MSIKANDVINLPVITKVDGREIFKVRDVVYNPFKNKVSALVVDEGGWFSGAKVIMIDDVESIGKDAVVVEHDYKAIAAEDANEFISAATSDENFLTKDEVMTEGGTRLGRVTDVYFDLPGGIVDSLEVSQGWLAGIASGNKKVRVDHIVTVGDKYIIVREGADSDVQEQAQTQGIAGAVKTVQEGAVDVGHQVQEGAGKLAENTRHAAEELGQRTQSMMQDARQKVQDPETQDQAQSALQRAREGLKNTGQNIAQSTEKLTNLAQEQIKMQRVKSAIGKTVGDITILTPDDRILAQPGDIITNELVQQADHYNVLEQLLNNVVN